MDVSLKIVIVDENPIRAAILEGGLNEAGYVNVTRIEDRTGRQVAIGAVYATLARLEEKGLVGFLLGRPQPVPGGRARKHFRLTPAGTRALSHSTGMLKRMMAAWRPETAR